MITVSQSQDFKEKTPAIFFNPKYDDAYFLLPKKGGMFAGREKIYFNQYKTKLKLLDETEQFTSLAGIAHGATTAVVAGVLGGAGSLAMGLGALAVGAATIPKKNEYYFLELTLDDGRQAILRASESDLKELKPFISG